MTVEAISPPQRPRYATPVWDWPPSLAHGPGVSRLFISPAAPLFFQHRGQQAQSEIEQRAHRNRTALVACCAMMPVMLELNYTLRTTDGETLDEQVHAEHPPRVGELVAFD